MAIGNQAGSIRIPASHCGIVGLKPAFGLVPHIGTGPSEITINTLRADDREVSHPLPWQSNGCCDPPLPEDYPRSLHVTLGGARCPAARLKHLAYLRLKPNLSCFGNHPNLES